MTFYISHESDSKVSKNNLLIIALRAPRLGMAIFSCPL